MTIWWTSEREKEVIWENEAQFIQAWLKERKKWVKDKNMEQTIILFYSKALSTLKIHRQKKIWFVEQIQELSIQISTCYVQI